MLAGLQWQLAIPAGQLQLVSRQPCKKVSRRENVPGTFQTELTLWAGLPVFLYTGITNR
jgi:hypothetical protein